MSATSPTTDAPDLRRGVALDVLSLNVWGLPWPIARARAARFARILEHLGAATDHIIGLQELWGRTDRLLAALDPLRPRAGGDSGLALAGGLRPVEAPHVHAFSRARGPDRFKAKGLLEAWLTLPGLGELRVLITHLQAGRAHSSIRAHQIDEILQQSGGPTATLLLGDFNLYDASRQDQASAGRLHDAGFIDAAIQAGDAAPTYCSGNPFVGTPIAERFDRIYLRSSPELRLEAHRTEVLHAGPTLSDHHPIRARLRLIGAP